MVPYSGRYYDYIVRKEYDSLNEWALENGETLDNIRYGVVKKHRNNALSPVVSWVTLWDLMTYLDPDYINDPPSDILAEFDDIVKRLRTMIEKMA